MGPDRERTRAAPVRLATLEGRRVVSADHLNELSKAHDDARGVIGDAEMAAAAHAYCVILEVFKQGARVRGHNGDFIRQGYNVQIDHLEDHLRARGKIDPDSGRDHLDNAGGRWALATALRDGVGGG